jgi:hypothetical protein
MMNQERAPAGFDQLQKITLPKIEASVRDRTPIALDTQDVMFISQAFCEAGVDVDLEGKGKEKKKLFEGERVRLKIDPTSGDALVYDRRLEKGERWVSLQEVDLGELLAEGDRTVGICAMLGVQRTIELVGWCYENAKDRSGRIGGYEGTQGRGLQQVAADLLAIATLDPVDPDFETGLGDFTGRINQGLWKGHRRANKANRDVVEPMDDRFRSAGVVEPTKKSASAPPIALPGLIMFLAGKQ